MPRGKRAIAKTKTANSYRHPESEVALRPDVGTQAQFRKKKKPTTYRYDSSLSPALEWDGQNSAREQGESHVREVLEAETLEQAKAAAGKIKALSKPFLNWAGKAEHLSFDVPTLPLFVHERLSTKAIIETLRGQKHHRTEQMAFFADPEHPITDQVLKAYEHQDEWVNRLILGDSLVVMNSLLHYENLGGQVQMIYLDPPYGVSFGSNFQPFVRKRDVKHNDDEHFTREPEMVQAYRDTWELGLHSYLTYLRDRLLLCRELLHASGSVFVQINDENLHHAREVMDEVFGPDNFLVTIFLRKKGSQRGNEIRPINDHLIWYAKDRSLLKRRFLYDSKMEVLDLTDEFDYVEMPDGTDRPIGSFTTEELQQAMSDGARLYIPEPLTSGGEYRTQLYPVEHEGQTFRPPPNNCWKFNEEGMQRIIGAGRLHVGRKQIRFKKYHTDFPYRAISNMWADMAGASDKIYVVQTALKALHRCILMTTDPGDLVLDPTCGSGTTAFVAEQWGRRWISIDVSRVPLALAQQRLLTATFPWYELREPDRGPSAGFIYERKQNHSGDEIGGIAPHITSTTIANDAAPNEDVIVDRPNKDPSITRVTGPFCVEATIPTPVDWEGDGIEDSGVVREVAEDHASFEERMLEILRKSPVLRLGGKKTINLKNVRPPAKTLNLSAEAQVENGGQAPVAFLFGPENGAVSQNRVFESAKEAYAKSYTHLYVIGFAIQPIAREFIEKSADVVGIPATYVQATPDLLMGDLLKNMRSSQIFSVCGLPEVKVKKAKNGPFQVELIGLDVFDPVTMKVDSREADDVPAWFLDTDYNGLCFHVSQAFFPRTSAWENLKKALKGEYEESVWDHLAGTTSAPFQPGEHKQIAVKVIDDRGNELLVVEKLPA